ncbi:hypothetical protein AGIG_G5926 [Arapaima gigas]
MGPRPVPCDSASLLHQVGISHASVKKRQCSDSRPAGGDAAEPDSVSDLSDEQVLEWMRFYLLQIGA